jgi:hypothetical protein
MSGMGRREFVVLLGGAAAWPAAARGQLNAKLHRIGMLETTSPSLECDQCGCPSAGG